MLKFIPKGSRVLDVGCSTGNFGQGLEQLHDCEVVGVDLNPDDIAEASAKISAAYVLDFTSVDAIQTLGTFDVILFADVLEHFTDPRSVLRSAKALLKTRGVVVYSIPNMGHVSVRLDMLEGRFPYTQLGLLDRTHLHFYDRNEVDDLFAEGGFTITHQSPTLVGYPEEWIASRLGAIGLTDSLQFHELLRTTDAGIYQFVGRAIPTRDTPRLAPWTNADASSLDDWLQRAQALIAENDILREEIYAIRTYLAELKRNPLRVALRAVSRRVRRG